MIVPISKYWILILGFTAQLVFAARIVVQWWISEKNKHVESPTLFWILSLIGSSMLFVYGVIRNDLAIVLGQFIGYFIYVRNLQLAGFWKKIIHIGRLLIVILPPAVITVMVYLKTDHLEISFIDGNPLVMLGIVGQLLFNLRFFY